MQAASLTQDNPHLSGQPLCIGFLPYLSPVALVRTWKPFVVALEDDLQRRLNIKSARDYDTFIRRMLDGRYDILMVPSHLGMLAKHRANYQIAVGFSTKLAGEILVQDRSSHYKLGDIRGLEISAPDSVSLVSIMGELLLRQHHLHPQKNIQIRYKSSHNNAILALANGKVEAALAIRGLYQRMAVDLPVALRSLAYTPNVVGVLVLLHPRLSDLERQRITEALLKLPASTTGQAFFASQDWGVPRMLTRAEEKSLAPLLDMLLARGVQ